MRRSVNDRRNHALNWLFAATNFGATSVAGESAKRIRCNASSKPAIDAELRSPNSQRTETSITVCEVGLSRKHIRDAADSSGGGSDRMVVWRHCGSNPS